MIKTNLALIAFVALPFLAVSARAQPFDFSADRSALSQGTFTEPDAKWPEPNFAVVTSHALEKALRYPDSFWEFVTAPEPPYLERMAAVRRIQPRDFNEQAQQIYPVERLPQLMAAIGELNRARRRFDMGKEWGLRPSRFSSYPAFSDAPKTPPVAGTEFVLVGHVWSMPAQSSDYPLTFEKESRAPWPWQLDRLLKDLLQTIQPYASVTAPKASPPFDPGMIVVEPTKADFNHWRASIERARDYHRAALQMPVIGDEEAVLFVEATVGVNYRPIEVMARWRRLALDASFAESAVRIARAIGSGQGVGADAQSRAVAQAITIDILRRSPHLKARQEAAMYLRELRQERESRGKKIVFPTPYATVLVAGQEALDTRNGDEWTRFYCYARGVYQSVDNPPFDSERVNAAPAEAHRLLEEFKLWFAKNKAQFQIQARSEAEGIEAARVAMEKIEPTL